LSRELVNRLQNIRKEQGFEVTDKILIKIEKKLGLDTAIKNNYDYICSETLAIQIEIQEKLMAENKIEIELTEDLTTWVSVQQIKN
ncbi:MAG: DUF5915 domain-containing protein, partial [Bacteroidales bacterium]